MEGKAPKKPKPQPVSLKPETYARLDAYLAKLHFKEKTTKLTFDDAVSSLLDIAAEQEEGSK